MRTTFAFVLLSTILAFVSSPLWAQSTQTELYFDSKGRLVLVVTLDGKQCVFQYSKDGSPLPSTDTTCRTPYDWLSPASPKNN
jgi:hypothetical protein